MRRYFEEKAIANDKNCIVGDGFFDV